MKRLALGLALGLLLTACAVPMKRSDYTVEKLAVDDVVLQRVIERYGLVRQASLDLLNPQPLATVQRGPLFEIDSGRIAVASTLQDGALDSVDPGRFIVERLYAPIVSTYPMWFVVVVRNTNEEHVKVQVYERQSSATDWILMASPEILQTTRLPALRLGRDDSLVQLDPIQDSGLINPPIDIAQLYVDALNDPDSEAADLISNDGFRSQMFDVAEAARSVEGVSYDGQWSLVDADFAVRTEDGGALLFTTVQRDDTYRVDAGQAISWPPGSAEQAFLTDRLTGTGTLRYLYQLLMYIPPLGSDTPYVLGHYGGVVGGEGASR